jgi:hypothetical protein
VAAGLTDNANRRRFQVRRVRIEQKARRGKEDRTPVLPVDPRDPEVLRAKRAASGELRDKRL